METQEKATVTLDGENYIIDDLSDRAKYFIGQLQDLQQQGQAARARVDQVEVAIQGFTNMLREEVKPSVVEAEEVEGA